ncbi:DUF3037 domain-containing protein [Nocardioides fonticola]|uniref:DUF3037 domain-containing protein n=1 Tax=Nocardioides fonticola TaxID=450363 RepID=A0ABP7XKD0_9ACTN
MSESSTLHPYQYVVLRCVPRVDREEFVNLGVVLYCQAADLLQVAWQVDETRLAALWPQLPVSAVREAMAFIDGVCAGDARGGAAARQPVSQRFGFLKAPRSTVIQPGPVHGGLSHDPAGEVARLVEVLVG